MQIIDELKLYHQFTKSNVFDKLHSFISNHSAILLTCHNQLKQQIKNTSIQIAQLIDQKPVWKNFSSQLQTFIDIFAHYKEFLQRENVQNTEKMQRLNENMLVKLQEAQIGFSSMQTKLLKHCYEQIDKNNKKIKAHKDKIETNKKQIQSYHQHCFVRMLEFARDLSQSNIKKKVEEKEYDLNTYGKMSSEMKGYLVQTMRDFEQQIIHQYKNVRNIQLKQQEFMDSAIRAFNSSDQARISTLVGIAHEFSNKQNQQLQMKPYDYQIDVIDIPQKGVFSKTERMENAVHITLHPLSSNELLIQHRKSLSFLLEQELEMDTLGQIQQLDIQLKNDNSPITKEELQKALQFKCPNKQPDQPYNFHKSFLSTLHFGLESCLTNTKPDIIQSIREELNKAMKFAECRAMVIFYMFYQVKQQKILDQKALQFLANMCNQCLKQAFNRFDSQSIIKLLIVAIQMTPSAQVFYKKLDVSPFSNNFQFWETTFIQNIYEYCEIMVRYYNNFLEQTGKKQKQGYGKFWNMFKTPNWLKFKNKDRPQKTSIKDIYHEIIKNTFTVYISLMRIYEILPQVIDKLVNYILTAIDKLNFPQKQALLLQKRLDQIRKIEVDKSISLLQNKMLVERSLSKLLGPSDEGQEQNNELSSLNESIVQWENQNQL